MPVPDNLQEVADSVHETGEPHSETVRTLLSWFDQKRRGRWVVAKIRRALREVDLSTEPDFETAYIDGIVLFRSTRTPAVDGDGNDAGGLSPDPVARIRMLTAANRPPTSITRDQTVNEAVTLMLMNDFSQLPVMSDDRTVQGMISWSSIGRARALGRPCEYVRDCVEQHAEVRADKPLLDAIDSIVANEVVLVRNEHELITGIVTTSDISIQFREMAEPFILVGEIENHLRQLIDSRFSDEELAAAKNPEDDERTVESVEDLTFGEYKRLLEDPENWAKLELVLDRRPIIKRIERVRHIRNDVMHFNPDGVSEDDLEFLRDTVRFFQQVPTGEEG